jgi:hypothetical protein
VFFDADGSVTGSPGHYVTVDNPFLVDGGCRLREDWNAWVCRQSYSRLSITANGSAGPAGITLTRADGTATVLRASASGARPTATTPPCPAASPTPSTSRAAPRAPSTWS